MFLACLLISQFECKKIYFKIILHGLNMFISTRSQFFLSSTCHLFKRGSLFFWVKWVILVVQSALQLPAKGACLKSSPAPIVKWVITIVFNKFMYTFYLQSLSANSNMKQIYSDSLSNHLLHSINMTKENRQYNIVIS